MSTVAKISVALTPELADLVAKAVETGDYATGSEVIREALQEWKQRRVDYEAARAKARAQWDEGLASGVSEFADIHAIKAEAHRRAAKA